MQLAYNVATQMSPNADGTPRVINGVAGLDRDYVKLVLEDCIVRNDQARIKPEEVPPPVAIVTLRALAHCQARAQAPPRGGRPLPDLHLLCFFHRGAPFSRLAGTVTVCLTGR